MVLAFDMKCRTLLNKAKENGGIGLLISLRTDGDIRQLYDAAWNAAEKIHRDNDLKSIVAPIYEPKTKVAEGVWLAEIVIEEPEHENTYLDYIKRAEQTGCVGVLTAFVAGDNANLNTVALVMTLSDIWTKKLNMTPNIVVVKLAQDAFPGVYTIRVSDVGE